jgi:hypothetical protein
VAAPRAGATPGRRTDPEGGHAEAVPGKRAGAAPGERARGRRGRAALGRTASWPGKKGRRGGKGEEGGGTHRAGARAAPEWGFRAAGGWRRETSCVRERETCVGVEEREREAIWGGGGWG